MATEQPINQEGIEGILNVPATPNGTGLVLAHGAGTDCRAPLLRSIAEELAGRGYHVLRCNLAFRQRRRTGPPHPSTAPDDCISLERAVSFLRKYTPTRLLLGGHSYGGRQASVLAAKDKSIADRLLLFSYPLHPPAKPAQSRTGHFPQLHVPCTFIHGSKDPFGSPAEMRTALELIPAASTLLFVEGAGHDLLRGRFDLFALGNEPIADL